MKKALLLLSGGIDSATCGAMARKQGYALYALSFKYGQRHAVELKAARKVAAALDVCEHRVITIDLRAFGGSSLTSHKSVPHGRSLSTTIIPSTYVPARNTIFLSYALAWAEVLTCRDIFIGVNAVDYSGYPDCRPEYIRAYSAMANLATKAAITGKKLTIHTPLLNLTKAQIVKTGLRLGFDYGITHSCYDPSPRGMACGTCDSCHIRRQGFLAAGMADPTRYMRR